MNRSLLIVTFSITLLVVAGFWGCGDANGTNGDNEPDTTAPVVLNGDTIPEDRIVRDSAEYVIEIDLSNMGISDPNCLSGVELYSELQVLIIAYNNLTSVDLSPLSSCKEIRGIDIGHNILTSIDLSPLNSCTNLEALLVDHNNLSSIDFSALAVCINMERLAICNNLLTSIDLSPLDSCTNLEMLWFNCNDLGSIDLSPLDSCFDLEHLYLFDNCLTAIDLSPIWDVDSLEYLYLFGNYLDSVSCAHVCDFHYEHPGCYFTSDCHCGGKSATKKNHASEITIDGAENNPRCKTKE